MLEWSLRDGGSAAGILFQGPRKQTTEFTLPIKNKASSIPIAINSDNGIVSVIITSSNNDCKCRSSSVFPDAAVREFPRISSAYRDNKQRSDYVSQTQFQPHLSLLPPTHDKKCRLTAYFAFCEAISTYSGILIVGIAACYSLLSGNHVELYPIRVDPPYVLSV